MVNLTRTMFSVAVVMVTTRCGVLILLSWVVMLLFSGTVWHLMPELLTKDSLWRPLLHDTISRVQKLLDICDAAVAIEVLQQLIPHVVTAQQMFVAYIPVTRNTFNHHCSIHQ